MIKKILLCATLILLGISAASAQKRAKTASAAKPQPIIFAVLNDGKTLEPIGEIDKDKLVPTIGGDADTKALMNFGNAYYRPKTTYNLIFGGAKSGAVTVKSFNPKSDCGKNLADVSTVSSKSQIKGLVMALATNKTPSQTASGLRRMPTAAERTEIETLVRAEFAKQKVSADALKNLHYHNLTALDVDNDGKAEMVGSFWAESAPNERDLLFFIAEKDKSGKYNFGYSEYRKVKSEQLMSGAEIKSLDEGVDNELLLDVLAYGGDPAAKIFTVVQGFEGNNFNVYSKRGGKWTRVFEGSNYHCAY
ncbi:MAG: hypothetical protein ACR2GD_11885 [Pyrinomonadaceae bacterium]